MTRANLLGRLMATVPSMPLRPALTVRSLVQETASSRDLNLVFLAARAEAA